MNNCSRFRTLSLFLTTLLLLVTVGDVSAQRRAGAPARPARPVHDEKIELVAMYGHMWGGNVSARQGRFRLGTAPSMFFALDIPLAPSTWVELSYGHQSGQLDLDRSLQGTSKLSDMSVNYWQLGMIRGMPVDKGHIVPYGTLSLGVTYINPSADRFEVDDSTYALDSATRFSLNLGVGVKAFFGEAQRFGLRAHFKTMPTFYNTGAGLWFGTGGAGVSVSGYAIWQWEVAGGITVKLG